MIKVKDLHPKSPVAEAYRTIRTNISFSDIDNEIKTILFTSTRKNEGKSTVAANVAYSFSKLENKKILLMDLDLRNPSIHKMFGVSNTIGIIEHLKECIPLDECIHKIEYNFHVLSVGMIPPNPSEILSSKRIRRFIEYIKEYYDYIFIDAPPVGIVSDPIIISEYIDGIIYVIAYNEIDMSYANIGIDNLKKAGGNIIGAVLNKYVTKGSMDIYYGDYYEEEGRRSTKKKIIGSIKKKIRKREDC